MNCRRCESLISPRLDGDLRADEARAVDAHLADCGHCASLSRQTESMIAAMRALLSPEPPPSLWTRIDERLDEKPAQRGLLTALHLETGRWRWAVSAIAVAGIAVGVGIKLHHPVPSDDVLLADAQLEFAKAEAHYTRAIADLRTLTGHERERWPDERRSRFDRALTALDEATERCRDATRTRPADADAEELLYGSYRRQIAFLEESLMRGATVDP